MNPNIPQKCRECGEPLLIANLYADDGCTCNSRRGVNFKPALCGFCGVDDCVKPGHRLAQLFGSTVAVCGATTLSPGYWPCSRYAGHVGPCAHRPR